MRFAVVETSSEWCSVALSAEGEITSLEMPAANDHGAQVLPMLEDLLRRSGLAPDALDAVVYGAGPGSFTGLRIACSIVQGLAFARDLPVLGVSSFEAVAQDVAADAPDAARVLVCLDARMGEIYCAGLERDVRGNWQETIAADCIAPGAVSGLAVTGWIGAGNGFANYEALRSAQSAARFSAIRADAVPRARVIAELAGPRLTRGEGVDAALAAPAYLRDKVARTIEERRPG